MLEQIYGTIMDVQWWLAAIHLQQIRGSWWIMESNHKSGFSWASCLIKLGSMDLYHTLVFPEFLFFVIWWVHHAAGWGVKVSFTWIAGPKICIYTISLRLKTEWDTQKSIYKRQANNTKMVSHRLPQHAGRRNEGSATSNRKDFLAKRSCLCSWHTGELMRWVGRCVVGSDGKGIAEVGLCDSERDVQLHPGKTNKWINKAEIN